MEMVQVSITKASHETLKKIKQYERAQRGVAVSYNVIIHELLTQRLAEIDKERHDQGEPVNSFED